MSAGPEVLIAGGGVIGSAIACFLAGDRDFAGRVQVIEPDPAYAAASTPRSLGGIRQQFSTPENIAMSAFGVAFAREAGEHLAVDGEGPELALREAGYLLLATPDGARVLEENHRLQRAQGAHNVLLTPAEIAARFPWLATGDLAAGCLGLSGEGWMDPFSLLQGFRRKARSLGVEYLADRVVAMEVVGARVRAVRLASGTRIAPGAVVNAAGAWAREVAALAGVELPVFPRRRQIFAFECREPPPDCPLVVGPEGLYFRPEGGLFLCGIAPSPQEDPDTFELEVDPDCFDEQLWPRLAARVPAFEAIKLRRFWAGLYEVNTYDANAILGPHPVIENLYFANGFSGHGLQQSPAVGRAIAEHLVHGGWRSIDLTRFEFARIAAGRPVRERLVL